MRSKDLDSLMKRGDCMKESSMLVWYPKIKDLQIPQPRTEIVEIPYRELSKLLDGQDFDKKYLDRIKKAAKKIGYPLFLRTDNSSQKHDWKNSCYVENRDQLFPHISGLIDSNGGCDLIDNAIILREFIPMYSKFTAFWGDFPVSKEMRFFIKDGEVQCRHWYWFDEVIRKQGRPKDKEWESKLRMLNKLTDNDELMLNSFLKKVCEAFPEGYWSVDFCLSKHGIWHLIDMARGEVSFHYPTCEHSEDVFQ